MGSEGRFFANADRVRAALRDIARESRTRTIVLDARTVPFIDVTAARMLADLTDTLHDSNVRLLIAHDVGQVRDVLRLTSSEQRVVYATVEAALDAASPRRGEARGPARE